MLVHKMYVVSVHLHYFLVSPIITTSLDRSEKCAEQAKYRVFRVLWWFNVRQLTSSRCATHLSRLLPVFNVSKIWLELRLLMLRYT